MKIIITRHAFKRYFQATHIKGDLIPVFESILENGTWYQNPKDKNQKLVTAKEGCIIIAKSVFKNEKDTFIVKTYRPEPTLQWKMILAQGKHIPTTPIKDYTILNKNREPIS
jgi:hypothetical protein